MFTLNVQFPSGTVRPVNMVTLLAQVQHAEMMSKFGMPLARNAPTLKQVRETYEIPEHVCRTWKQAAPLLRMFHTDLSEQIQAAQNA